MLALARVLMATQLQADAVAPTVLMLPVEQLTFGLDFRLDDDADAVAQLAVSISELGMLQPIVVRQIADGWEVVAGRRRLTAARVVGLDVVPCVLRSMTDDEAADVALAENLHRRNLSPVEEGLAFARLRKQGLTQTQIGERVGRSQTHVSMLLRVLDLPEELRQKVHRREMSYVTALDRAKRPESRRGGGVDTRQADRDGRGDRLALAAPARPTARRDRRRVEVEPEERSRLPGDARAAVRARPQAAAGRRASEATSTLMSGNALSRDPSDTPSAPVTQETKP